ncbi:MAG: PE-PPE domain-containing protein [Elusimicrobia bacterium]|nr:PE-PPE domain-containing protein [Elusimicrobiota bacterium]
MPGLKFEAVSWGPITYELFSEMAGYWFPGLSSKDAASEATTRAAFAEYNKQFDPLKDAAALMPELNADRPFQDDNYLEARLAKTPACAKLPVVPFPWSRNPVDTAATIAKYVPELIRVYDNNRASGRPVYILAHSWGSVIMHDVLNQVAAKRPDIKIDKFITLGSPLMPGNFIVNIFSTVQHNIAGLSKKVNKPANVRYWRNVWARHDFFSNAVTAADINVQVDASVGAPETELTNIILYGYHKLDAKTDLIALLNIRSWHTSYYHDYDAYFKTIDRRIRLVIFDPQVAAPLLSPLLK